MEVMKKCILSFIIMIGMVIGIMIPVKAEELTPLKESSSSYLFSTNDGYERVKAYKVDDQHAKIGGVTVEKYTSDFKLVSQTALNLNDIAPTGSSLDKLYSINVYEGSNYNFILTSQVNTNDDVKLPTIRVTRYTKDWVYSANCELNASDHHVQVHSASVNSGEMMEHNGQLWVSIGHTGFAIGGLNHQGKLNFIINIDDMSFVNSASDLYHSFNQYLTTCNGEVYEMELSEGARCVYVEKLDATKYVGGWSANWAAGSSIRKDIFDFFSLDERPGGMWAYDLGGSTYGFASSDSSSRLLSTGLSYNQDKLKANVLDKSKSNDYDADLVYNAWICSTSTDLQNNDLKYLTNYADGGETEVTSGPYLVKVDDHKFLAIWGTGSTLIKKYDEKGRELHKSGMIVYTSGDGDKTIAKKIKDARKIQYCFVNEYGDPISSVSEIPGKLKVTHLAKKSNGDISWCSGEGGNPVFYTIHSDGTNTITDTNPTYDLKDVSFSDVTYVYDGQSHLYASVANLPDGVKVKYTDEEIKDKDDLEKAEMASSHSKVGTYTYYANFYCENQYGRLINDQAKVAHMTILPKDISQVRVAIERKKNGTAKVKLYNGALALTENEDYSCAKEGDIITYTGIHNYTGTLKVNVGMKPAKSDIKQNTAKKNTKTKTTAKKKRVTKKSKNKVTNSMKNVKSDEGPKGTTYQKLQLKCLSANAHSMKVGWKKMKGCSYVVYEAQCGKVFKKITTTTKNTYTFKKLKKKTFYKVLIVAKKGNKEVSLSKSVHIYTGKGNTTKVKCKGIKTIKKGQRIPLKITTNQKVAKHRSIKYESGNKNILKVTKQGIKSLKKGKAALYAYAQDGVCTKMTIVVK